MKQSQPKDASYDGDRPKRFVDADIVAIRDWVVRHNTANDSMHPVLDFVESDGNISLVAVEDDIRTPVAQFVLTAGRWQLQWFNESRSWQNYDDKTYLTPAIPLVFIDENRDGLFWR